MTNFLIDVQTTEQIALLTENSEDFLAFMRTMNEACNWLSEITFREKTWHWADLQKLTYYECRERFGLRAAATIACIRKVSATYRAQKTKDKVLVRFRGLGGVPVSLHVIDNGEIRFYGHRASISDSRGITLPKKPPQAVLVHREGRFYLLQPLPVHEPETMLVADILGVDLGIRNLATDSEGERFSGTHLRNLRNRRHRIRQRLQAKGTKSAKRRLLRMRRKESRHARAVNHVISKRLVAKAERLSYGIALEDLKGIRQRVKVRKAQRRDHASWGFHQLRTFVEYKAQRVGVPVFMVDPAYTSQTCPSCGYVDKRNRPTRDEFRCVVCSYAGAADHIAAINIGRRAAQGCSRTWRAA